jgi:hypothetical protein
MLPPPPDLFTTVSDTGNALLAIKIRSMVRAVLSLLPPGGLGTTSSTFLVGTQDCAVTAPAVQAIMASGSNFRYMILDMFYSMIITAFPAPARGPAVEKFYPVPPTARR